MSVPSVLKRLTIATALMVGTLLGAFVPPMLAPLFARVGNSIDSRLFGPQLELERRSAGLLTHEIVMTGVGDSDDEHTQGFLGVYVIAARNSGRSPSDERRVCFSPDGHFFYMWDITAGHELPIERSASGRDYVVSIPPVAAGSSHELAIFTLNHHRRTTDAKPVVDFCR